MHGKWTLDIVPCKHHPATWYAISSGCGGQTRDHLCEVPEMGGGKTCRGKVLSLQSAAFSHHVVSDVFQCARITTNVGCPNTWSNFCSLRLGELHLPMSKLSHLFIWLHFRAFNVNVSDVRMAGFSLSSLENHLDSLGASYVDGVRVRVNPR